MNEKLKGHEIQNSVGSEPNTRALRFCRVGVHRACGPRPSIHAGMATYPFREIATRGYFRRDMLRGVAS
jgi:hypothetical protein